MADMFGMADVTDNDCDAATDWLPARQDPIQWKLAAPHPKALSPTSHCRPHGWHCRPHGWQCGAPENRRLGDHARAHIFLCLHAHTVEWPLKGAWRERLFADEDQAARTARDPAASAGA